MAQQQNSGSYYTVGMSVILVPNNLPFRHCKVRCHIVYNVCKYGHLNKRVMSLYILSQTELVLHTYKPFCRCLKNIWMPLVFWRFYYNYIWQLLKYDDTDSNKISGRNCCTACTGILTTTTTLFILYCKKYCQT